MAQEALGFMQNSKGKNLDFIEILSKEPDNILSLDVSSVKTLQIGYQAETLLLHKADDDTPVSYTHLFWNGQPFCSPIAPFTSPSRGSIGFEKSI